MLLGAPETSARHPAAGTGTDPGQLLEPLHRAAMVVRSVTIAAQAAIWPVVEEVALTAATPRPHVTAAGGDVEPVSFNTLASARALVPAGDGSRGQTVIRRYLLGNLHGRFADGGLLASNTDLATTRLVASLDFGAGIRLSVYAASVRPTPEWRSGGSILIGVTGLSKRPIVMFTGTAPARRTTFELAGSCVCAVPRHTRSLYDLLTGGVPTGVSHVAVRTSDGREHGATIFSHGRDWIWVGHARSSQRPVALIGRDSSGAVVTRRTLHGRGGFSR